MKKFLILLAILLLTFIGFIIYDSYDKIFIPRLEIEEDYINIDELYIYGTHLNISGRYNFNDDAQLVLYNGQFIAYDIMANEYEDGQTNFSLSNFINDGIYLDVIPSGNYYMFLRVKDLDTNLDKEDNNLDKWKYFPLKNNTEYLETIYYTMSNYEKRVTIENEDSYPTMMMNITKVKSRNVYDIVLDPGHGGMDGGASNLGYKETDFTLDLATKVKEKLEDYGFKVKLTHEIGQVGKTEMLEAYGENGRAVIPREVNAKYLFSFHLNSSYWENVNGFELYTAKNINYDFARILVNNVISSTGLNVSSASMNKIETGIYSRNFTENEILQSFNEYSNKGYNPYDITTNANYYFMIRETGGIVTGAYVDDRNSHILPNLYLKSNVGTESYLLELGYISNRNDLYNIVNNMDKYVESISNSIKILYDEIDA
jgi:N-acetylmuramoyl-L-alanine amidase